MGTYKPKGSPYFHFDFQFRGVRYHGSTGCTSKRAADAFERRERHAAALPDLKRPPITLDEACGLYEDHAGDLPSWPTIEYMIEALLDGLGANVLLSAISQRDLQTYFAGRRSGRANSSVNREIENTRAIWRRADATRYDVGEMPDWKSLRLKVGRRPPRELADKEETGLFKHLREDVAGAVDFLLKSGWRRGEVLGLRWKDVNFPAKTATTKIKGGDVVVRPLTTALVEIIAAQPHASTIEGAPFVFTYLCEKNRHKRRAGLRYPLTATALRKPFAEAKKAAGIDAFRIHDLRHTRGTRIVRATGSLAAAKEALKHRSISTTLRYAHVLDDDVRNALDASESRNSPEVPKSKPKKSA